MFEKIIEMIRLMISHCGNTVPASDSSSLSPKTFHSPEALEVYKYETAIQIWHNQATKAFQENDTTQCEAALHRKWQYQKRLADYHRTEAPLTPEKPEEVFKQ